MGRASIAFGFQMSETREADGILIFPNVVATAAGIGLLLEDVYPQWLGNHIMEVGNNKVAFRCTRNAWQVTMNHIELLSPNIVLLVALWSATVDLLMCLVSESDFELHQPLTATFPG